MEPIALGGVAMVYTQTSVAAVLMAAGLSKLANRHTLRFVITRYRLLSVPQSAALARVLPEAEIAIAVMLCLPITMAVGAIASAALFAALGAAIGANLVRGNTNIACGCFGSASTARIGWGDVIRNAALCTAACYLGWLAVSEPVAVSWAERAAGTLAAATTLLCYWLGRIVADGWKLNQSLAQ